MYLAGTDVSLGVLDGLGRTLPLSAETQGTISLSARQRKGARRASTRRRHGSGCSSRGEEPDAAGQHRARPGNGRRGSRRRARRGDAAREHADACSGSPAGSRRILVHSAPGKNSAGAARLAALANGRLEVAGAEQDIQQLQQALHPSSQASALFAIIGALLGLLLAFNAILLTVPERRQAIADLRLSGTPRSAIMQLALFQALCLGVAASTVGIGVGYVLARWVFHQSTGYLAEAFALNGATVVSAGEVLAAAGGGLAVTLLASARAAARPTRAERSRDAVYLQHGVPGNALSRAAQRTLGVLAVTLAAPPRSCCTPATGRRPCQRWSRSRSRPCSRSRSPSAACSPAPARSAHGRTR